jgi:dUTP pyrophosphatase
MHVQIKIPDAQTKSYYENHSSFHEGDAGLDVFTPEKIVIMPLSKYTIKTGIHCEATENGLNCSFWMLPRSSVATKTPLILANSMGLIDAGYRGELMGVFYNTSNVPFVVDAGTRLLQICSASLMPVTFELVDSLSETSRGEGGYGSTGK